MRARGWLSGRVQSKPCASAESVNRHSSIDMASVVWAQVTYIIGPVVNQLEHAFLQRCTLSNFVFGLTLFVCKSDLVRA